MLQDIKRISPKHKNNKILYYAKGYFRLICPNFFTIKNRDNILKSLDNNPRKDTIVKRVEYYCKDFDKCYLPKDISVSLNETSVKELGKHGKVYFFDTYQYLRYFDNNLRFIPLFGDITHVPDFPSITKSRPIKGDNRNSVILNLDKIRHFLFINDNKRWTDKKDMLVGRSKARQQHRIDFLKMYKGHPLCDVGQVNRDMNHHFIAKRMTIDEHLDYKFILCLEGNDVASNLKWVMSSNSLAVSPVLKYETWFMEGHLIPNEHFVAIKDDYSDLPERLEYYMSYHKEALEIIENAHQYTKEMNNPKDELLCSLMVLYKYFNRTNQL